MTDRVVENTFKLSALNTLQYNNDYCKMINNIVNAVSYHIVSTLFKTLNIQINIEVCCVISLA